jgi:hypothetical protein
MKKKKKKKKKKLRRELHALAVRHDSLADAVRRLAAHTDVLAVAVRSPDAVPEADLDTAISGINHVRTELVREDVTA